MGSSVDFLGFDIRFWIACIGAAAFKAYTAANLTIGASIVTFVSAMFCAVIFTEPLASYFAVADRTTIAALAAILALTGEHFMRHLISATTTPENLIKWLRLWLRGNNDRS